MSCRILTCRSNGGLLECKDCYSIRTGSPSTLTAHDRVRKQEMKEKERSRDYYENVESKYEGGL